ncbi:MAG TPA: phosphatase PAP2 family protein [Acidimicrobiales bacterium]|jgi:undecaprenyl-diphosphatase|nr:phosphatase PAP2 family protein [Acidimicrobiales bacterium]
MTDDLLSQIDDRADVLFDRLRGRTGADGAAAVLSNLADYGLVWVVLAGGIGRHPGPARRRASEALALSGTLSFGVNKAVKLLVRRERPEAALQLGSVPVRAPSSSSFPSGHTLAAFSTAVMLPTTPASTAACLTFAGAVAASRVHLGHHHASDVLGGAIIGAAIGLVGRRVLTRRHRR